MHIVQQELTQHQADQILEERERELRIAEDEIDTRYRHKFVVNG
jgi:hypothetical protein